MALLMALTRLTACRPRSPRPGKSWSWRYASRHGVANRKALLPKEEGPKTPVKTFKAYEPGFVHVDINYPPQMPDQDQRTYLFAAIDRATRWVCP